MNDPLAELKALCAAAADKKGKVPPEMAFMALRAAYARGYQDSLKADWEERTQVLTSLLLQS